ncbi:MAG: transketolase [Thermotogota bacterium]|nr:transketolase [Thermotogota bacterium]
MRKYSLEELKRLGNTCRSDILKMTTVASSGHPGGSMSSVDIYLSIYNHANISPENPFNPERDRIVVSHGHTSPGVYSVLGRLGFFDIEEAITGFRHPGTIFEGHITRGIPGIEWSTGNLGQGLSAGAGMALAAKLKKSDYNVFVAMGDAEQAKGQVAEARRTAIKYRLNNIVAIVDYNDAQITGKASDVMKVNIKETYEADGWKTIEIDGHNYEELDNAIEEAINYKEGPIAILAKTVMGKGVSFMENDVTYHGKSLDEEQCKKALKELNEENDIEKYKKKRKELPDIHEDVDIPKDTYEVETGKPTIYKPDEKLDNRTAFGKAVADLGRLNKNKMAVIDCDLKPSTKTNYFKKDFPESFIQIGVQEHNAATVAGAMSISGLLTFFGDFGVFGIDETYNQQRLNDINKCNLKVGVTHVGIDVGEDGKTHHCVDYIGALRNFYGFKLIVPADPNQTDSAVRYCAKEHGNFVIAVGRSKLNPITKENGEPFFGSDYSFEYGEIDLIRKGKDATLISTGQATNEAVKAHELLKEIGIEVTVLNVSCPLHANFDKFKDYLKGNLITIEDHNVNSGLGVIASDYLLTTGTKPVTFKKLGLDRYFYSGSRDKLYELAGIDSKSISKTVENILK